MTLRRLQEIERRLNGQMKFNFKPGFLKVSEDEWKETCAELIKGIKKLRREMKHKLGFVPGDD